MTGRWLPRNTTEKLVLIDTTLADIVPRITLTREHITDLIPGHSGRPAGNGEPGGSHSGVGTSIVERTHEQGTSREQQTLDDLDHHTNHIETAVNTLVIHAGGHLPTTPTPTTPARRLAWCRWAIRILIQTRHKHSNSTVDELWKHTRQLEAIVDMWTEPHQPAVRSTALAVDDTDTWCCSHLRIGSRVHRSDRYPKGLCRWCGDFHAEQGFLPTLRLLDAHESGKRITMAMVDEARPTTKHPRRRKLRR